MSVQLINTDRTDIGGIKKTHTNKIINKMILIEFSERNLIEHKFSLPKLWFKFIKAKIAIIIKEMPINTVILTLKTLFILDIYIRKTK